MKNLSVLITVVSSLMSGIATAGVLTFHPESAIYAGNGCLQGRSHISVDEAGDLLIEHEDLILDLPSQGRSSALAGRRACTMRIPVTLPQGYYVKAIEQQIQYSVSKSAHAEARIATRTALSGDAVNPFTVLLAADDEFHGENMIDSRRDYLGDARRRAHYCEAGRAEDMMLQISTVISGQRDSIDDELVVAAYGGYIGEGIELEIAPCP
jgi:hypothetical protein